MSPLTGPAVHWKYFAITADWEKMEKHIKIGEYKIRFRRLQKVDADKLHLGRIVFWLRFILAMTKQGNRLKGIIAQVAFTRVNVEVLCNNLKYAINVRQEINEAKWINIHDTLCYCLPQAPRSVKRCLMISIRSIISAPSASGSKGFSTTSFPALSLRRTRSSSRRL